MFVALDVWVATAATPSMLAAVPWAIGIACVVLCLMIVDTQRTLWRLDRPEDALDRRRHFQQQHRHADQVPDAVDRRPLQ